ncbi:MAG: STAS domain-containing protein, partial [Solirubrobacteraceae bacterium]
MEEQPEKTGRIRLGLIGELDVAGADQIRERLDALSLCSAPLLLDLRRLRFIDSSGLGELVRAVSDAHRDGGALESVATLSPLLSATGLAARAGPDRPAADGPALAPLRAA